jgi:hypothetical protein
MSHPPEDAGAAGRRSTSIRTTAIHPPATRVIYRDRPYLLELNPDRSILAAFGPFTPGTEPSLAECGPDTQVQDAELLDRLVRLLPISPDLPAAEDTLAGG